MATSLKLQKAYYYSNRYDSDMNAQGNLILKQGWVVTGFIGETDETYVIPMTYAGLPIIGILYTAYDQLSDLRSYYVTTKVSMKIYFNSLNMLFVFPPRRYNDRCFIEPTYIVEHGGNVKHNYSFADWYHAMYFSYKRDGNLLSAIYKYGNVAYNYGYESMGFRTDTWRWTEASGKQHYISATIKLSQASNETYRACNEPQKKSWWLSSCLPDGVEEIESTRWDALHVGKYFRLGKKLGAFEDIKEDFDKLSSVLVFAYASPTRKTPHYAFNLISGTEVVITPKPDDYLIIK